MSIARPKKLHSHTIRSALCTEKYLEKTPPSKRRPSHSSSGLGVSGLERRGGEVNFNRIAVADSVQQPPRKNLLAAVLGELHGDEAGVGQREVLVWVWLV